MNTQPASLADLPIAALQELHRVAEANGWGHIENDVQSVMLVSASDRIDADTKSTGGGESRP